LFLIGIRGIGILVNSQIILHNFKLRNLIPQILTFKMKKSFNYVNFSLILVHWTANATFLNI